MSNTALRSCSVIARGMWIDMLCLMHDGSPYGYLRTGRKDILPPILRGILGLTLEDTLKGLQELEDANVFSRDENGVIYCPRMIRDEDIRVKRASGGAYSLLNPKVQRPGRISLPPSLRVSLGGSLGVSPSSSSSSSSKEIIKTKKTIQKKEVQNLIDDSFDQFYSIYPRVGGKGAAKKIWSKNKLHKISEQIIEDVLARTQNHSQWKDPQFICSAKRYLDEEIWNDPIITENKNERFKSTTSNQHHKIVTQQLQQDCIDSRIEDARIADEIERQKNYLSELGE